MLWFGDVSVYISLGLTLTALIVGFALYRRSGAGMLRTYLVLAFFAALVHQVTFMLANRGMIELFARSTQAVLVISRIGELIAQGLFIWFIFSAGKGMYVRKT